MRYAPKNCLRCGGKKMKYQKGGNVDTSIVDYMKARGLNSNFNVRASFFNDYFGNEEYRGTAEQNVKLLHEIKKHSNFEGDTYPEPSKKTVQAPQPKPAVRTQPIVPVSTSTLRYTATDATGTNSMSKTPEKVAAVRNSTGRAFTATDGSGNTVATVTRKTTPIPVTRTSPKKTAVVTTPAKTSPVDTNPLTKLESGVVTDKGKNIQYVIQNGKVIKSYPVLNGQASRVDVNPFSVDYLETHPGARATPLGDFFMQPNPEIYGKPGFNEIPLADKQGVKSVNYAAAIHNRYDPANRDKLFSMKDPRRRDASYGCTNLRGEDIDCLTGMFPKGDTVTNVDSRTPKGRQVLSQYGIKRMGGILQGGGYNGFPKQSDYPDYESWQQAVDEYTAAMGQQAQQLPKINIQQQAITDADFLPTGEAAPVSTTTPNYGALEPKRVDDVDAEANRLYQTGSKQYQQGYDRSLGEGVLNEGTAFEKRTYRNFYRGKYGEGINPVDPFQVGLGLQTATTGLSWLSGIFDRRRQNRYKANNLSTLGRFESQPVDNFQPNPYNLYAKLGGNIKKYMFTNDAINNEFPVDAGRMKEGGKWIQKAINPKHKGWCTPLSNPHCTGHRRALALRFKHGL